MFWLLLIILLCIALGAVAEEPAVYTCGDYQYELLEDGSASITSYLGTETELEIPAELDGHPVSTIGDESFFSCDSITRVMIPLVG